MYQVPNATQRPNAATWRVGVVWIVAMFGTGLVGSWLYSQVLFRLAGNNLGTLANQLTKGDARAASVFLASGAVSALVVALAQWLVLRRYFVNIGWWVLMIVGTYLVYYGLMYLVVIPNSYDALNRAFQDTDSMLLQFVVQALPEIIYGCVLAIIQALFFRDQVARPFLWAWASIAGVILGSVLTTLLSVWQLQNQPNGLVPNALSLIFLVLSSLPTAWVLVRFVRERQQRGLVARI